MLADQDGDRVGLLARRAAQHPDSHPIVGAASLEDARNDFAFEHLELGRIAEELRDADQQVLEQVLHLERIGAQPLYPSSSPICTTCMRRWMRRRNVACL